MSVLTRAVGHHGCLPRFRGGKGPSPAGNSAANQTHRSNLSPEWPPGPRGQHDAASPQPLDQMGQKTFDSSSPSSRVIQVIGPVVRPDEAQDATG
jgi:hypothetical protein